jgi:hypothetical protein
VSADRQPSERAPGSGRSSGGRVLAIALAVAVVIGLGAGFAVGATTKGKSQAGPSSTLAPTIAISGAHVASVPAPYAIASPPGLHASRPAPKAHTAPSGETSGTSASDSTTSSSTQVEPVQTQAAPPAKIEPTHTQAVTPPPPPAKKSEKLQSENGAS